MEHLKECWFQTLKIVAFAAGGWLASIQLGTWVLFATLIGIIIQNAYILWKWRREARKKPPPQSE